MIQIQAGADVPCQAKDLIGPSGEVSKGTIFRSADGGEAGQSSGVELNRIGKEPAPQCVSGGC